MLPEIMDSCGLAGTLFFKRGLKTIELILENKNVIISPAGRVLLFLLLSHLLSALINSADGLGLVYWGLTPQQQPGSYQGGEMVRMKSVFWWRKPEYPEETTDLRQVTDETFHTHGLCPVRGLNLGRSGVKQSGLRRDESDALAHRATAAPNSAEGWPT